MNLLKNKKGQGLVEYMIIVALMAVSTMGIIRVLSQTSGAKLASITQSLQGGKASVNVKFEKVDEAHFKKKDMSNFFQGSRSRRD
ncbi:MAG: hypothetical protein HRT44_01740 [Bdellovibrionales bacterium]|nr:hypothetical protein [Bdellovibrionales bacterium]NQZ17968.1 hypothetical protein [Bdellovibrionales bacterium]